MHDGQQMRSFLLAILSSFSALRTALLPMPFLSSPGWMTTSITFEGFAPGTTTPLTLSFPGAGLATLTQGDGTILLVAEGITNDLGRYGISPTNFLDVDADANLNNNNLRITFAGPIAAFGFYGMIAAISLAPLRS